MKKNIILCILMLSNLAIAQNEFPQNDDVLIKGKSLRISRPITTGGWEQGVRFFDLNNQNQYAELGMKGTADNSERIFIAHGINDNSVNSAWLSKKSINLLRDGKVGIGTTAPNYRLDVQGDFRSQIGNNEFIVKPSEFVFKGNTPGGWTKQLKLGNDNGTPKFAAFGAYGSGQSNKLHFAYIDGTGNPKYDNRNNVRVYSNGNLGLLDGNVVVGTSNPTNARIFAQEVKGYENLNQNIVGIKSYVQPNFIDVTEPEITSMDIGIQSRLEYRIPSGVYDRGYKAGIYTDACAVSNNFKGTLRANYGMWSRAGFHAGGNNAKIKEASGIYAQIMLRGDASTTIENAYGVRILSDLNNSSKTTVNNKYDLYAETPDAKNYFAGTLGVGTTNMSDSTGDYRLSVKGKVRADEVKVYTGWSDFVFEKDYNLPTLKEVEQHINEKGHLKDIPNAKEVEENGVYLGEINAKLLQKIEELTLYTIQQEKDIKSLNSVKDENKELKQRVDKLEKLVEKLIKK